MLVFKRFMIMIVQINPNHAKQPVEVSYQYAAALMKKIGTPVKTLVMAGYNNHGDNYVCWFKYPNNIRIDFFHYHHLYARAVSYNSVFKMWNFMSSHSILIKNKLINGCNIQGVFDLISSYLPVPSDGTFTVRPMMLPIFNGIQSISSDKINTALQRLKHIHKYYIVKSNSGNNHICLIMHTKTSWGIKIYDLTYHFDLDMETKTMNGFTIHMYNSNHRLDQSVRYSERLIYLNKNIHIASNIFTNPQISND